MVQKLKTKAAGKVIVGLTGSFGSGKSTAANLFQELGAAVINADRIAHETLREGVPEFEKIAALFPQAKRARELDRKKIAEVVFKKPALRKQLEGIIHPYVLKRTGEEIAAAAAQVVILEVPLLFEAGFDWLCDKTIVVNAPPEKIRARLIEKGFSPEDVESRSKAQWPIQQKIERADFVLNNEGTVKATQGEVEKIWSALQKQHCF